MKLFLSCVWYWSFNHSVNLSKHSVFILSATLILLSSLPLNLIKIKEPVLPASSPISMPKILI